MSDNKISVTRLIVPTCEHCKKLVFTGIIVHGNVNLVDVISLNPEGDGGGFIGSNFPSSMDMSSISLAKVSETVKKSVLHLGCFIKIYREHEFHVLKKLREAGLDNDDLDYNNDNREPGPP